MSSNAAIYSIVIQLYGQGDWSSEFIIDMKPRIYYLDTLHLLCPKNVLRSANKLFPSGIGRGRWDRRIEM